MRDYDQARQFAIHEHQQPRREGWYNSCQMFSRQCVGAPSFGLSARQAFNSIKPEHRHTSSPPPPGSIAYYGRADQGFGHAVFAVEGGKVWSNDIIRHGQIDRVDWDIFIPRWGLAYRGWIDTCPAGALPVKKGGDHPAKAGFRQQRKVYRSKMRLGQEDSDSVWNLQLALIAAGLTFTHGPTGYYGERTRNASRAFQRRQGWRAGDANGIAGPQTVARLGLVWVDE
jgi:Putative peptidoglycan binding domain